MNKVKKYLLPATGFTILVVALLLVNPLTGNAVPSEKDVRVINSPLEPVPTRNINEARQPYQAFVNSTQSGTNVSTATIITVPAGKRLVIEFVSMSGQVPPGQHAEIMEIQTVAGPLGGASHQFVIEGQPPAVIGDSLFRVNQSLRLYADPGTQVRALFRRNTSAGSSTWNATISGYLVDVP